MATTLPIPETETYQEFELMLYDICHKWYHPKRGLWKRHGVEFEDLVSDANFAFSKAYNSFDVGAGASFCTFLYSCVENQIKNRLNKLTRSCRSSMWRVEIDEDNRLDRNVLAPQLNLGQAWNALSTDADLLVKLALDTPQDLKKMFANNSFHGPTNFRACIRKYLKKNGWDIDRIKDALEEVGDTLAAVY